MPNKSSILQRAIELAVKAHRDGEDPPGEPYIVHPMRVMLAVSQGNDADQHVDLRCTAILHDVLERSEMTVADLKKAKIPRPVIIAVELLTHDKQTSYADYVVALKVNAMARQVKIADLLDNADLRHVTFRPEKSKDRRRVIRYAASYKFLTGQMDEKQYRKTMKQGE